MSFVNKYYKRTAGTAKPCYVCYKPTTTVLATLNTVDFVYTCPAHLSDSGFATLIVDESKPAVSAEEIARVKAEWEERQKKKLEKEKEKEKEEKEKEKEKGKDAEKGTSKDKDKSTDNQADSKGAKASPKSPGSLSPSPLPSASKHEQYMLHRDYFTMRQNEHRRRRQAAQAKALAPRLPGAPRETI